MTVAASACAHFGSETIPDPFPPGAPYDQIVREIRLEGNRHTREDVIRASIDTKVGEPYDRETASKDYNRLFQLGVFRRIRYVLAEHHSKHVGVLHREHDVGDTRFTKTRPGVTAAPFDPLQHLLP